MNSSISYDNRWHLLSQEMMEELVDRNVLPSELLKKSSLRLVDPEEQIKLPPPSNFHF